MIILHLIRHAQQDWNRETPDAEWPLTALGQEQALNLINELEDLCPDSLWCSKTRRAFQTIEPYAKYAGLNINQHPGLGERKLTWPLPPMEEMKEHYRRGWENLDYSLPQGESNREGQIRFISTLEHIVEAECLKGKDRNVVICAHGNVIALAEHVARGTFGNTNLGYCERRSLALGSDG